VCEGLVNYCCSGRLRLGMNSDSAIAGSQTIYNGYTAARPAILGLAKLLFLGLCQLSAVAAAPLSKVSGPPMMHLLKLVKDDDSPANPEDPSLWLYLGVAAILVLLGGAFAGLTIA
jgi:metal transporter CNNM